MRAASKSTKGVTAMTVSTLSTEDAKVGAAKDIINAWCRIHKKTPAEIPAMAEDKPSRIHVGILAHTVRTRIELGIMPLAGLLGGINPGRMTELRILAADQLEKGTLKRPLQGLLVTAGLGTPVSTAHMEGLSRSGILAKSKIRAGYARKLALQGDAIINAIIVLLGDADRKEVLGPCSLQKYFHIRWIVFAVLYSHVVDSYSKYLVREFCGMKSNTSVCTGVTMVSDALTFDRWTDLHRKILLVCDALRIGPETLKI